LGEAGWGRETATLAAKINPLLLGVQCGMTDPEQNINAKAQRRKEVKPIQTLWELSGCWFGI
jgi:hypothetical protein